MTESDFSYNGWTNYETWVVNLWLTNDEATYSRCRSLAQQCTEEAIEDAVLSRNERACYLLSNELREMLEDGNPLVSEASVYSDLLNAALSEVAWREIANSFLEELKD